MAAVASSRLVLGLGAIVLSTVALAGCEVNGARTSHSVAVDIVDKAEEICGANRREGRGGVENIMLMDGRTDDGIVTCHDGTNHPFDA